MTIKTKYNQGDRVIFHSDDYAKNLKGKVKDINIECSQNGISIDYTIQADKSIKSSNIHIISEKAIVKGIN